MTAGDGEGASGASFAQDVGVPERARPTTARDESFGQLLSDLSADTSKLVRQEVALAQAELTQKAKAAGKGAGMFAGAAVMALAMLGALTAFLIVLIDLVAPLWAAALAITVLWALVAAVLALAGRTEIKRATPVKPEQTVETVKEDVSWAKNQAKSARK
jgi:uncharacterized membrane protein YqjE